MRNSTVEFTGHSQQRFPDTVPRIQSSLDNETKRQRLKKIQNKIVVRCSQKETRKERKGEKRMKKPAKIGKSSASRRTKISCHVLPWKINRFRTPPGRGCGFHSYCHLAPRWSQPVLEDELTRKFSVNASACMKINDRGVTRGDSTAK